MVTEQMRQFNEELIEEVQEYKNNEKFKNFVKATFVIGIALYRQFNKSFL